MAAFPGAGKNITRSTPQLYRDCLRLIQHIAGKSTKGQSLRNIIRNEFRKNLKVTDPVVIDNLKSNAIRGLANYLMIESAGKDKKLQASANEFSAKAARDISKSFPENCAEVVNCNQ